MNVNEQHLRVEKTARYYINTPIAKEVKSLWFVIHGYAQLAKDFVKEFEFLSDNKTLIVAPEALSRFYFRDKIGASWMTREDRQNEINDYLNYFDVLMKQIKNEFDLSRAKLNLLGFSQGVHTAARFFINTDSYFDNLILCSSDFPGDADFIELKEKLKRSKMYYIFGNSDKDISIVGYEKSLTLLNHNSIPFEKIVFDGRHVIHTESLKKI